MNNSVQERLKKFVKNGGKRKLHCLVAESQELLLNPTSACVPWTTNDLNFDKKSKKTSVYNGKSKLVWTRRKLRATCQPVHVVNVDIQDNPEEATLGAFLICELCQCIQHTEDMENEIEELLQEFEEKSGRAFLHTICFY